jgi:hypothetical protein
MPAPVSFDPALLRKMLTALYLELPESVAKTIQEHFGPLIDLVEGNQGPRGLAVTFKFFHPVLKLEPLTVKMAVPPRVGEMCSYEEQHYRVADVQYLLERDTGLQVNIELRAVM